jgi:hypothetical protein
VKLLGGPLKHGLGSIARDDAMSALEEMGGDSSSPRCDIKGLAGRMPVQAQKESLLLRHDQRIRFVVRACPQLVGLSGVEYMELLRLVNPHLTLPSK